MHTPQTFIDLRSDTVTRPTSGMRRAMAEAEVGDDMMGEDPTVNRLEARMAEVLGKEAAVFACSGMQSNQMAVWAHCSRGDELLTEQTSHIGSHEAGAPAVLSAVTVRHVLGECGRLDVKHLQEAVRPADQHFSPTRLLSLENSTNLGGGRTYSLEQLQRVSEFARTQGWKIHMDGARLFNACIARNYSPADVGACVDTVSICFSKGLGCPMGSILAGSESEIFRARQGRKLFGGALRQAGIVAAAALYALDQHVSRLAEDHALAQLFAREIAQIEGIRITPESVETNLIFFELDPTFGSAKSLAMRLRDRGVRLYDLGPHELRACTHLDLTREDVLRASRIVGEVMADLPSVDV